MPSIKCKCDTRVSFGDIPNRNEWLVISDSEYDGISGSIDAEALYARFDHVLCCPTCSRLIYFPEGFNGEPVFYLRE
jgi:hypothetical protein